MGASPIAPNFAASAAFTCTNTNKCLDGNVGRGYVAMAQLYRSIKALGMMGLKQAQYMIDRFDAVAKTDTYKGKFARSVYWANNNINPLITACVAAKILTSDDKEKAFCTDGAGLMGMFLAEGQCKKLIKSEFGKNCLAKVSKMGGRYGKTAALLSEGALFAATSIAGYAAASKIGETCIEAERAKKAKKKEFECIA